jgi:hypothetical protein
MVLYARRPRGVTIYPTTPTIIMGGVSMMVTASTVSFLFNSIKKMIFFVIDAEE